MGKHNKSIASKLAHAPLPLDRQRSRSIGDVLFTPADRRHEDLYNSVANLSVAVDFPDRRLAAQAGLPTLRASDGGLLDRQWADEGEVEQSRAYGFQRTDAKRGWMRAGDDAPHDVRSEFVNATNMSIMKRQDRLTDTRDRLLTARAAVDRRDEMMHTVMEAAVEREHVGHTGCNRVGGSPGAYTLYAMEAQAKNKEAYRQPDRIVPFVENEEDEMYRLLRECRENAPLNQVLLYDPRFDDKWRARYTDVLAADRNNAEKTENRKGWVLPLKRLCDRVGIDASFFTKNKKMELGEAREQVLLERLRVGLLMGPSRWLTEWNEDAVTNPSLLSFMRRDFDAGAFKTRLVFFNARLHSDKDRVRVHGQYYNNIFLGKRMFGPSKKQKFESSICGGMERRFEILDNQVNHIPFTHAASDAHPQLCRNKRVKCCDASRVVLRPISSHHHMDSDFIHANHVQGGSFFNRFILTQAPMQETIDSFWHMVWQERAVYIFMLISRHEPERCARYWPSHPSHPSLSVCGGLVRVECEAVDEYERDPLFRITYVKLVGPDGEEHRCEHWQGDMNNADNVYAPLTLLRLARNSRLPSIVHDHLGISRAACVLAAEAAICNLIRGPTYQHTVMKAVHFVRSMRPYAVETPMQYIYIHKLVLFNFGALCGSYEGFADDHARWLEERSQRMFLDDVKAAVPGYRLLSPRVDPDLLRMARRPERPDGRKEAPSAFGEMPIPLPLLVPVSLPAASSNTM